MFQESLRSEQLSDGEYMTEAFQQYAGVYGEQNPDQEWLSTPFDTWERNPHYTGKPGRHPEDDYWEDDLPIEGEDSTHTMLYDDMEDTSDYPL